MKIGSIVVLADSSRVGECLKPLNPKDHYTVRGFLRNVYAPLSPSKTVVYLEEIINELASSGREMGYAIESLKEVSFPPSLTEEIREALERVIVQIK